MKKILMIGLVSLLILTGCTSKSDMVLNSKKTAEMYDAKETFVLYVTSSTCPACQIYDEVYDDVSSNYKNVMYKIDYQAEVGKNEEEFTNLVVNHLGYVDATPTTIFIVDGEEVGRSVGIMKYSDLENSIKNYKISK
ncbi:MAG TPA: thioredoxin family protein [Erysipelotrichaceae bacterium]|nr:thioredoxin family protein [Erysipelotrichaceae bacterium]